MFPGVRAAQSMFLLALILLGGCATTSEAPPAPTTLSTKLPVMSAMPETKPTQAKGGLEISIAPVTYKVVKQDVTAIRQVTSPFMSVTARPTDVYVEETTKPKIGVTPDRIAFTVKINNKLPRVFRGAGTVVQFNVGGKLHAVDQAQYVNMQNAIVPPRSEQQIEIYGPPL